jgi:hypothetical protein
MQVPLTSSCISICMRYAHASSIFPNFALVTLNLGWMIHTPYGSIQICSPAIIRQMHVFNMLAKNEKNNILFSCMWMQWMALKILKILRVLLVRNLSKYR